ncbi:MAG: hypothetical protein ACRECE_08170, partial [Xanthobacteraceae bacterium]
AQCRAGREEAFLRPTIKEAVREPQCTSPSVPKPPYLDQIVAVMMAFSSSRSAPMTARPSGKAWSRSIVT